jgi:DNA-binding beta-propeller fold protein YncE
VKITTFTGTITALLVFVLGFWSRSLTRAWASLGQALDPPKFQVDPLWPRPLPDRWVTGEVAGACVDSQDHVFILDRSNLTAKEQKIATASPPVIEFDQEGGIVNSWGDLKIMPTAPQSCFVDYQGNTWITGSEDGIVQKYSHDGSKLLLQIGTKGDFDSSDGTAKGAALNSSHVFLNGPTSVAVDPANGDVYVADGYGNRRIAVFDRDGHFLRQWGRLGTQAEINTGVGGTFLGVVHCVVLGNDGLVYVPDRPGNRIEVFDKAGNFRRNIFIDSKTARLTGIASAAWVLFSSDPAQKFIYVADAGDEEIRILDHATGQTLATLGRPGHQIGEFEGLHGLAVDSKGDIITVETLGGRRVQMFRLVTPPTKPSIGAQKQPSETPVAFHPVAISERDAGSS